MKAFNGVVHGYFLYPMDNFVNHKDIKNIQVIYMPHPEDLGSRLFEVRGKLSRKEFAQKYGIHEQTLIRYENGQRRPDSNFIRKIADGEQICEEWLISGEGPKYLADKKSDMSDFLRQASGVHSNFSDSYKSETSDTSDLFIKDLMQRYLKLAEEHAMTMAQNGDLRVEIERLRMDLERRDMRIRDLEREVAELREARKGPSAYGAGVAGSAG
ncbi:helix-turn-helix domain-containing protein [Desulfovibrio piger]|uniref:helix-turn-helix domain-containing protein n=1 Tax=Desulfovibrio piger TaxID=901 RepID=UPI0039F62556